MENPGYTKDVEDPPSYSEKPGAPEVVELDHLGKHKPREEEEDDPWEVVESKDHGTPFSEKSGGQKALSVLLVVVKIVVLLGLLYLFICSLGFLSDAFKLVGGKAAGEAFAKIDILNNPITCLMIGVLATVLLQSSSTTTSIVVAMVAALILPTQPAIYIIMGANIGTTVTNTIVSLGQAMDRNEFRRAFGGATVHDMFNWLCVLILLPIEAIVAAIPATHVPKGELLPGRPISNETTECGMLCHLTRQICLPLVGTAEEAATKKDLLKVITKPFTSLIVQVNKDAITNIAKNESFAGSILKMNCKDANGTKVFCGPDAGVPKAFLFSIIEKNTGWSDVAMGAVLLVIALLLLIICLVCIVKLLHSLLRGQIANVLKRFINADFPGCFKHLTGYVAILLGAGLTMLVQSSSIFTSAITPLVGIGVLHLERMFPLTLGSNIGTTLTAILASIAQDADRIPLALQVALCHLFFNIIGIIIWYPLPFMRAVPIALAKGLGNTTADHRWFAIVYLFLLFFIIPGAAFGLSVAGWQYLAGIGGFLLLLFIIIVVINVLQRKKPSCICCPVLRNWNWLPRPFRSLSFYDEKCICCSKQNEENTHM